MTGNISIHRFVRIPYVWSYLRLGWMPLPTLENTHHGAYSVDMVWLCECGREVVEPRNRG